MFQYIKSFLKRNLGFKAGVEKVIDPTPVTKQNENTSSNELDKNLGISYYEKGEYKEALQIFERLNVENPSSENQYLLSLTNLKIGELELAIELYEKAIESFRIDSKNLPHSIPNMKTYFADQLIEHGKFSLAFKLLQEVSDVYCKHKILDATFLVMRGIPIFTDYLETLAKLKGEVDELSFQKLINTLEQELRIEGKKHIDDIIRKNNTDS